MPSEQWILMQGNYEILCKLSFLEFDVNVFEAILSIQRYFNLTGYIEVMVKKYQLITHAGMKIWIW